MIESADIDNTPSGPATFPFLGVGPSRGATSAQFQELTPALGLADGWPEVCSFFSHIGKSVLRRGKGRIPDNVHTTVCEILRQLQ